MNAVIFSILLATMPTGASPFSSPDLVGRTLFFGGAVYLLTLLLYVALRGSRVDRLTRIVLAACIPVTVFSAYLTLGYVWNMATEARVRYITGEGFAGGGFDEILFWDRVALWSMLVYGSLAVMVLGGLLKRVARRRQVGDRETAE